MSTDFPVGTMDGKAGAESRPGIGSRFWFRIPVDVAEGGTERRKTVRTERGQADNQQEPAGIAVTGRILLAEDNAVNQKVIVRMLKHLGLEVQVVENGSQAVGLVKHGEAFDLVLLDVNMPEMNGLDATRAIREYERQTNAMPIPIVSLTADAFEENHDLCTEAGMNDFLPKPVSIHALKEVLRNWLKFSPGRANQLADDSDTPRVLN